MEVLRTPEARFDGLTEYSFTPHYTKISVDDAVLRLHHIDEGPVDADPVLLLHGEPTWSYLYRKMIPMLAEAGHRVVALDFVGFGRSDKPGATGDYSYQRHVDWTVAWLNNLNLHNITLVAQDWGGLIGLRILAEQPERFARVIAANTFLPTGEHGMPEIWERFRQMVERAPELSVSTIVERGSLQTLSDPVKAAYDAPFPDERYKAGVRAFPNLVPRTPDDPAAPANREAWKVLSRWEKPFLTAFSDGDPITRGADKLLQQLIPGAQDQEHTVISGAGHFLQEDKGRELASVINRYIETTT